MNTKADSKQDIQLVMDIRDLKTCKSLLGQLFRGNTNALNTVYQSNNNKVCNKRQQATP